MPKVSLMYSISDKEFIELVNKSSSISEVCRFLGYNNVHGNTNDLFRKRCSELDVDISHFNPYKAKGGIIRTEENVFCENSTASQEVLRRWFKNGKYVEYKCSICGINT